MEKAVYIYALISLFLAEFYKVKFSTPYQRGVSVPEGRVIHITHPCSLKLWGEPAPK
jgi:hypothetical protein